MAIGDPSGTLASPLTIINCQSDETDIAEIQKLVIEYEVNEIVVGLPISLNGTIGPQAEIVKEFTAKIARHTGRNIVFRDEKLSTVTAKKLSQVKKQRKKKLRYDAMAAAIVLQEYLDELKNRN